MKKWLLIRAFSFVLVITPCISSAQDPLPPNLIALSSSTGSAAFNRSYRPDVFWPLALHFVTQEHRTWCGIASSVMVLNALKIPAPKDPVFLPFSIFTQNNFFTANIKKILPIHVVNRQGVTLDEISRALKIYPVSVRTIHANDVTISQFRAIARDVLQRPSTYIIVDYSRKALGQNGEGHMSPLAVYDKQSDRFLVLDVARYRYPAVWVKTADLWHAMYTKDALAHAFRGFVIIGRKE